MEESIKDLIKSKNLDIRSLIFTANNSSKPLSNQLFFKNGWLEVYYSGQILSQTDLKVWEFILKTNPAKITAYNFINSLGYLYSTTSKTRMANVLNKLASAQIALKVGETTHTFKLLDSLAISMENGKWVYDIKVSEDLIYNKDLYTTSELSVRDSVKTHSQLTLWLHGYLKHNTLPDKIDYKHFKNLCKLRDSKFKTSFRKSVEYLKSVGYIKSSTPQTSSKKRYFITSILSNQEYNDFLVDTVFTYCNHIGAELIILKKYVKPTKLATFPPEFENYYEGSHRLLAPDLLLCSDLPDKRLFNVNPMTGFKDFRSDKSLILNHPTLYLQAESTSKNDAVKMIYTVGCLNHIPEDIKTLAAYKAKEHHKIGGLLVEVEGDEWFTRQVEVNSHTGQLCDLDISVTGKKVEKGQFVEAVVFGDIHENTVQEDIFEGLWGSGGLVDCIKPKYQFIHDLLNFRNRNHHEKKKHLNNLKKYYEGKESESVEEEIKRASIFLSKINNAYGEVNVVCSNHDLALERWVEEGLWDNDYVNSEFYSYCSYKMKRAVRENRADYYLLEDLCYNDYGLSKDIIFLREDESVKIKDSQFAEHGHNNISSVAPIIHGHTHRAKIYRNVASAGLTGNLNQGYNKGSQYWTHSHIIKYENGGVCCITQRGDGRWRV